MSNFPASLDTTSTLPTNYVTGNVLPAGTINNIDAVILAVEAKLGIGASSPSTVGQVLTVTSAGQTAWAAPTGGSGGSSGTATSLNAVAVSATAPSVNQVLLATSSTAASWTTLTTNLIAPRVVAGTYAATITPNANTTDIYRVILTGNATIAAPSGTPYDGQPLEVHVVQDATGSRTVTWASTFAFGTGGAPALSTGANKYDVLGFRWSAYKSQWLYYGNSPGF